MDECKTVLGWFINTRTLTIALPPNKHKKWGTQIHDIIKAKQVSTKTLEVLIGRLNHPHAKTLPESSQKRFIMIIQIWLDLSFLSGEK